MSKIATLSFDDGGTGDLKVMAMLRERRATGTFYLPSCALVEHWYGGMGKPLIAKAYDGFEIGAHGRLHLHVGRDPVEDVKGEVVGCVGDLRRFFGAGLTINCFSWPYGGHTGEARTLAERTYKYARSIIRNDPHLVAAPKDKTLMPITGIFAGNASIFLGVADNELPIHVLAHPWEIGLKWEMSSLMELADGLLARGYALLTNIDFFEETWRAGH